MSIKEDFADEFIKFFNSQGVRFVDENGNEIKSIKGGAKNEN